MPQIDLSMLNQRQTPAFYADVLANRPAAGFIGRIFVSTNTYAFYRDNGTSWDLIGGPGTGTITGSGAAGQVSFWNGASTITGENNLWWDSANNHLGINTNTPATALDVNHNGTLVAKFNNTTSANSLIAFENAGNEQWWIGTENTNNDFLFYDATNFPTLALRTTFKTSGQVLIGGGSTGSGKLVVESAASDNGIQIVGATAPSLRIDNANTAPTKRIGLGIATALNNFIQGAVDRDMTIFNGSTTASPILFGIYDTTNVQEAARISAARNFIVGKTTDSGERLQIQGTANFSSTVKAGSFDVPNGNYFRAQQNSGGTYQVALGYLVGTNDLLLNFSDNLRVKSLLGSDLLTIASSGAAVFSNTLKAYCPTTANQSGLIVQASAAGAGGSQPGVLFNNNSSVSKFSLYLDVSSNTLNFGDSAGTVYQTITSAGNIGIGTSTPYNPNGSTEISTDINSAGLLASLYVTSNQGNTVRGQFISNTFADEINIGSVTNNPVTFLVNSSEKMRLAGSTGNLLLNTSVDAGQKLQVNGGASIGGELIITGNYAIRLDTVTGTYSQQLQFRNNNVNKFQLYLDSATNNFSIFNTVLSSNNFTVKSSGVINLQNVPTSAVGLSSGDIYSNAGILTIVP